MYKILFNKT